MNRPDEADTEVNEWIRQLRAERDTERSLADDLANVLTKEINPVGWAANRDEVERVLARHREARQR